MILFLRNLPEDTTRQEIIDFVMPAVRGGIFRTRGKIISIDILAIRDCGTELMEYHGLVHISPDDVGQRAIRKLHGQMFKGRRMTVREYIVRSWRNDRRDYSKPPQPVAVERRKGPIRRHGLKAQIMKTIKPL
jgi:RNA recognition motif-containing protein